MTYHLLHCVAHIETVHTHVVWACLNMFYPKCWWCIHVISPKVVVNGFYIIIINVPTYLCFRAPRHWHEVGPKTLLGEELPPTIEPCSIGIPCVHEMLPPSNTSTKWGVHTKQIQKHEQPCFHERPEKVFEKIRYRNAGLESTWSMFLSLKSDLT